MRRGRVVELIQTPLYRGQRRQRVYNWSASGGATVYSMIHVNEPLKLMRSFATTTTTTRNEIRHDDEGWAILETSLCNLVRRFFASVSLH